jgi:isocitrate lyase
MQVLIPTAQFVRSLVAARLAADVCGVPTVLIARTDAHSANLLTSDVDERDRPFIFGERTPEGFHLYNGGIKVRVLILFWSCILSPQSYLFHRGLSPSNIFTPLSPRPYFHQARAAQDVKNYHQFLEVHF